MHNAVLTDWIKLRSQEAELVLSVCTGALLLAKAGLLAGVTGVPMFVIGSQVLTGLQDRETLEAVIEEEVKAHESPTSR
jgi:putative intracellular protease/amidase